MSAFLSKYYQGIFIILVFAIAGIAFYCGILIGQGRGGMSPVQVQCSGDILSKLTIPTSLLAEGKEPEVLGVTASEDTQSQGAFAGSKNGTKYYTPGCAGLERIKPENRIWFQNAEDATLQGYTPASC